MKLSEKISKWISQKVKQAGARGVIFGLSGGIDSAVVAALCKKAFPNSNMALIMPCYSLETDIKHAQMLAKKLKIKSKAVKLNPVYDAAVKSYGGNLKARNLALANLKPRLRMASLYYFANKMNYLVVGTGNRSELEMGYFTKYGDGGVDILPIGSLLKKQVYALAKELDIPSEIIKKAPSAGLWQGQTDEDEMGIKYAEIDDYLEGKKYRVKSKKIEKILLRQTLAKHKTCMPEVFKVL